MSGDHLRMTFYNHCLPLSLFRVLKGRNCNIYRCSSIGGHRTYIHCMWIAKAILMWCMECMCIPPYMKSCLVRGRSCPRRQPSSPTLSPHHVTLRNPDLILTYRTLTCPCLSVCPPCCSCFFSSLLVICFASEASPSALLFLSSTEDDLNLKLLPKDEVFRTGRPLLFIDDAMNSLAFSVSYISPSKSPRDMLCLSREILCRVERRLKELNRK